MTSVGNQLYTTANRSLKIWDIESMKLVSDLAGKTGAGKVVAF